MDNFSRADEEALIAEADFHEQRITDREVTSRVSVPSIAPEDIEDLAKRLDYAAWKGFNQSESEFEKGYKHAMSVAARVVRESAPASPAALIDEAENPLNEIDKTARRLLRPNCTVSDINFAVEYIVSRVTALRRALATTPPAKAAKAAAEEILNYFGCRVDTILDDHQVIAAIIERCFSTSNQELRREDRRTQADKIADQLIPHLDHAFLLTKGWRDQIATIIERSLSSGS